MMTEAEADRLVELVQELLGSMEDRRRIAFSEDEVICSYARAREVQEFLSSLPKKEGEGGL